MDSVDYLIVGGGIAAARAAAQTRERDATGTIVLVGEERELPYDRPPLSKEFLRGGTSRRRIRCHSRSFYRKKQIRLRRGERVLRLELQTNPAARYPHRALLASGGVIGFKKGLLATGGIPRGVGELPGVELPGIVPLRTMDDALKIKRFARRRGKRIVIIGAGFIGLELAASLSALGADVTVVERMPRVWPRFGPAEVGTLVDQHIRSHGVRLLLGATMAAFAGRGHVAAVETTEGQSMPADLVCVCVGIEPRVEVAQQSGLELGDGIQVDSTLCSSQGDLFSAGDVAEVYDPLTEMFRRVEHYGQAEYTGALAGRNMAGDRQHYDFVPYVWSDIFQLHLEAAGTFAAYPNVVERGDPETGTGMYIGVDGGRIVGYVGVNAHSADYAPLQLAIKRKLDLADDLEGLRDPTRPVAPLVQSRLAGSA